MAKDKVADVVQEQAQQAEVDYSSYTKEQLLESIGKAYKSRDMKLMGALSKLYTKKEGEEEKAKKAALEAELTAKIDEVKLAFDILANNLIDTRKYDGADGFWYAKDFGEKMSVCRLTKGKAKVAGASAGKSSYVAGLPSSEDMLKEVGDTVYLSEDTTVTIDKVEQVLPAGTTYSQAYKHSTNGGWRNRVRMALGKATGRIS